MRRDDEAAGPGLQTPQIVEVRDRLGVRRRKIEQQHVLAAYRPLDAGNDDDPPFARVRRQDRQVELPIVKRHGERRVAEGCCPIDERSCVVGNQVGWILARMRVEVGLQHVTSAADYKSSLLTTNAGYDIAIRL